MGLAGTKVKQRFGLDPRNTNWSNDKSRFGHQYLERMGWEPGKGLGLVEHAMTTHVKVTLKEDNVGLGAKLAKRSKKGDDLEGDSVGLDVFQRILGRLNGKEDEITDELERQRKEKIINGKWGMHFVKGAVLRSTWDTETKSVVLLPEVSSSRKRKVDESGPETSESSRKKLKKLTEAKKDIALKKEKSSKKEKYQRRRRHQRRRKKKGKKRKRTRKVVKYQQK
ncbi:uncharacterized protein RJT20DRAFT_54639 [Scheffersomyces xylosifermentans]|uniref:uncharacterized protein n=1 Tax=Scheffersomyces xylosifermentans TaxID=1304137 RepID=UPI00315DDA07